MAAFFSPGLKRVRQDLTPTLADRQRRLTGEKAERFRAAIAVIDAAYAQVDAANAAWRAGTGTKEEVKAAYAAANAAFAAAGAIDGIRG